MGLAIGTKVTARVAFTKRELTAAELATYVAGGGLPVGVGVDQFTAKAETEPPGDAATTTVSLAHDGTGEYSFTLTLDAFGIYRWRGVGKDNTGKQTAATPYYEVTCGEDSAATIAGLVEAVKEDGQFDASEAQVLRWLDERHRRMVAESKCYRQQLEIGKLVSGQALYVVPPTIIEIMQVTVGGYVYGAARHSDFAEGELGYIWLGGTGGIAGRDDSGSGESLLRIFPAPSSTGGTPAVGSAIMVYAAMQPPPLQAGQDSAIKVGDDYLSALVSGAIATGMLRMESRPDLAQPHETVFADGVAKLVRATNRRYRGTGPALIRVVGVNA